MKVDVTETEVILFNLNALNKKVIVARYPLSIEGLRECGRKIAHCGGNFEFIQLDKTIFEEGNKYYGIRLSLNQNVTIELRRMKELLKSMKKFCSQTDFTNSLSKPELLAFNALNEFIENLTNV